MTEPLPMHFSRLDLPFSWHLAAELCWRVPGHNIFETHPAGGQYDCLSIRGPRLRVDINRGGSVHALANGVHPHRPAIPRDEVRELLVQPEGVDVAVSRLLTWHGLQVGDRRPPTTEDSLTYRVIAAALSRRFFREHWDCRALVAADEYSETPTRPPAPDLADVPANQVWALLLDGQPRAHLARGWAVTVDGDRLNLMAAYDRGASVDDLAERLMSVPAKRSSSASAVSMSDQPQRRATWPDSI